MNTNLASNVGLLALAIGALSAAVELAKSLNYIGAGICIIVGIVALVGYEKLPPSSTGG